GRGEGGAGGPPQGSKKYDHFPGKVPTAGPGRSRSGTSPEVGSCWWRIAPVTGSIVLLSPRTLWFREYTRESVEPSRYSQRSTTFRLNAASLKSGLSSPAGRSPFGRTTSWSTSIRSPARAD